MAFKLRSPAFAPGGEIPIKHACDGSDVSPPLRDVARVDREQEHVEHHLARARRSDPRRVHAAGHLFGRPIAIDDDLFHGFPFKAVAGAASRASRRSRAP